VAVIIGVVCARTLAGVAYIHASHGTDGGSADFYFALTVGIAIFCGIIGAVLVGTCVPMLCHRFGVDPAIASDPFVTTIIDIGTQTIYLTLATLILFY
jgi:magnesium transporter